MPTRLHRIQLTEDPEFAEALRAAAPHLPSGLSRAGQVRELALAGARALTSGARSEQERRDLLERLAQRFHTPQDAGIDWNELRNGKRRAWPAR